MLPVLLKCHFGFNVGKIRHLTEMKSWQHSKCDTLYTVVTVQCAQVVRRPGIQGNHTLPHSSHSISTVWSHSTEINIVAARSGTSRYEFFPKGKKARRRVVKLILLEKQKIAATKQKITQAPIQGHGQGQGDNVPTPSAPEK